MSGTTGVVVFDYTLWSARYPELASSVSSTLAGIYFTEATLYLDNTQNSIVSDASAGGIRALLLNMLVAHIAALNATINGEAPSGIVGRIDSAAEGSVNVSASFEAPGTAAWFAQTRYGAAFWQATVNYRTMQYSAPYQPFARYNGCV